MPPAPRPDMAGDFLVPLLRSDGGAPDPVAIETWHLALASTVAVEIPHDLFALWLFPQGGGTVLLGPAALAQDRIEVPEPAPRLEQDQLYGLEETLRRARYPSAIAVPVRGQDGTRDAGALLLGSFGRGAFGPREARALQRLAAQLAPALGELSGKIAAPAAGPAGPGLTRDELPEQLGRIACDAVDGPDLVRRASGVLYQVLPHDWLEILAHGPAPGTLVALSGSRPHRRWSSGGDPEPLALLAARFSTAATLLVPDLDTLDGWMVPLEPAAVPVHSLLGGRLSVGGEDAGYVLIGSAARDGFRPDDEELAALMALLLAPRVQALARATSAGLPAPTPSPSGEAPPPLPRAAAALGNTPELSEGLRRFGEELGRVLPHDGFSIYLRRGTWEVIAVDPELPQPFGALPGLAVEDCPGAPVLLEDREWVTRVLHHREELYVPLRVAGRTMGALGIRTRGNLSGRAAAAIARPFADVLAPHLEIVRRSSMRDRQEGVSEEGVTAAGGPVPPAGG